jgi:hypothetical protein
MKPIRLPLRWPKLEPKLPLSRAGFIRLRCNQQERGRIMPFNETIQVSVGSRAIYRTVELCNYFTGCGVINRAAIHRGLVSR